jgi:hypothetical protein
MMGSARIIWLSGKTSIGRSSVLNQKSITQHESQTNSPPGSLSSVPFLIVKELGKDRSLHCVLFLELKQKIEL